ncbi:MAG TPA: hypothetical protein H9811_09490 [Candidatus Gemmiger excrementigallinarum]|uniref:Uncharacterized protein n=1 Tax=Candidatus Gemmiger excrementigallinarum TaxID=2838609 RepID=A0A9D2ESR0_9FIRM|nr:hypothetical protein [Candidatus Gemmiger excrementigallinarum]
MYGGTNALRWFLPAGHGPAGKNAWKDYFSIGFSDSPPLIRVCPNPRGGKFADFEPSAGRRSTIFIIYSFLFILYFSAHWPGNRIFKFIYKEVFYVHENGLALVW